MNKIALLLPALLMSACATTAPGPVNEDATPAGVTPVSDMGMLWAKYAAEYEAVSRQAYQVATAHLPGFIADESWDAIAEHSGSEGLPPAVILDVDTTVLNHVDFQISYERPFENWKLDEYDRNNVAKPVPGVVEFMRAAQDAGVQLFFVTNRPCELRDGIDDPCPQRQTVIDGLSELGFDIDAEYVMLSQERGWNREKSTRRLHIAETHRVIMLFGDDLTDFIACTRGSPKLPCTEPATRESRLVALREHSGYWGRGWYILPNPMHGSWTSLVPR